MQTAEVGKFEPMKDLVAPWPAVNYMLEPDGGFAYEQPQTPPKEKGMHRWSSDVKKLAKSSGTMGPQEKTIRMYEIYIISVVVFPYLSGFQNYTRNDTKTILSIPVCDSRPSLGLTDAWVA